MKNKTIDHSLTYKYNNIFNLPHIIRLNRIKKIFSKIQKINNYNTFLDIGCSNGYITNELSKCNFISVLGLDHNIENINFAKKIYPHIDFNIIDLNIINYNFDKKFDLITCFETLEHVGSIEIALQNILNFKSNANSTLILTVPIEIGLIGTIKFLFKLIKGYELTELEPVPSRLQYFKSLLLGQISSYRIKKNGWSTHFGFDYRLIDNYLNINKITYSSHTSFTTRFFII